MGVVRSTDGESAITRKNPAGVENPARSLKDQIVAILDDNKAEDIVTIPLENKSAIADYMVIATGRSARHVMGLAENVGESLQAKGLRCRFEGRENGDWIIADAGEVIVHIFRPEVRSFYNLEKMWCSTEGELPSLIPPPRSAGRKRVAATL